MMNFLRLGAVTFAVYVQSQTVHGLDYWVPGTTGGRFPSWAILYGVEAGTSYPGISIVDVDMEGTSANTIAALHASGSRVICYFSAGTFEDWRSDQAQFPENVFGKPLPEWPRERWLDIRSTVVRDIMTARIELAKEKGCDGLDPDNVDGWANDNGLGLTGADTIDYINFLVETGHLNGMSVGLKNNLDQIQQLAGVVDFGMNEQCLQYKECAQYKPMVALNKVIFGLEYEGSPKCAAALAAGINTIWTDLLLTGPVKAACYIYAQSNSTSNSPPSIKTSSPSASARSKTSSTLPKSASTLPKSSSTSMLQAASVKLISSGIKSEAQNANLNNEVIGSTALITVSIVSSVIIVGLAGVIAYLLKRQRSSKLAINNWNETSMDILNSSSASQNNKK